MARIDLSKIDSRREMVGFPTRDVELRWLDAGGIEIASDIYNGNSDLLPVLMQRLLPDATDEERRALTIPQMKHLLWKASGGEDAPDLGESSGGEAGPPTPPSSPST